MLGSTNGGGFCAWRFRGTTKKAGSLISPLNFAKTNEELLVDDLLDKGGTHWIPREQNGDKKKTQTWDVLQGCATLMKSICM